MAGIETNPQSMKQFADLLEHIGETLKKEERLLFQELSDLGATWKDQRYQQFDRLITQCANELVAFHNANETYADFLRRKAAAGERFLRG